MINVYNTIIDEDLIIGVGYFSRMQKDLYTTYRFDLYLKFYKVEISTLDIETYSEAEHLKQHSAILDAFYKIKTAIQNKNYNEYYGKDNTPSKP